jgi:hypothetical protein
MPLDNITPQPEPTMYAYRDQLIGMVRDRREASDRYGKGFRMKLPRLYDLWRGVYTGNHMPTKNNVHIPMIYSAIWSDAARKMATSFSSFPALSFRGFGEDDAHVSRKHESIVDAQLRDARCIEKELVTFVGGDLYGTAVSQLYWDHKEEVQSRTDWKSKPISGERVRQIMRERVTTFDGPNYRNVDLLDFYPCPNFRSVFDMPWVIVRYYLDIDEVEFMASEEGGNVFDMGEVQRLKREGSMARGRNDEMLLRRFESRTGFTDSNRFMDKWSRPIEIIEMWGRIPRSLAGPMGTTNVVISVANDNFLLRATGNQFHHQMKPFLVHQPTPDPHYFYAPGKAEVAEKLQVTINRIVNQLLDAGDLVIHPMFMYNRNKGVNTRNLIAGPGRVFGTDGDPREALAPVPFDMRGMQIGAGQIEMLWRFLQMGSGVQEDTIMGLMGAGGSDRQTAREFLGRREASGTRLMLESVMYEHTYLEPMGNMFMSMNQQLLEVPREVLILGDAAKQDPVTGEDIPVSRETVNGWDLVRSYSARALGSTMSISKTARQQTDLQVFQILASSQPYVAGAVNLVNFLRQMFRNLDYPNVNEFLRKTPQLEEILAQRGMQGGVGSVPESGNLAAIAGLAGNAGASPVGAMQGSVS